MDEKDNLNGNRDSFGFENFQNCNSGESKSQTALQVFLEQHFLLVIIGSVVGGVIVLVLIISAVLSFGVKRKKRDDLTPLTDMGHSKNIRKDTEENTKKEGSVPLSRGEKQALSLILRANKD